MPALPTLLLIRRLLIAFGFASVLAIPCLAQPEVPDFGDFGGDFGSGSFGASPKSQEVNIEAEFTPATEERPAMLFVTATIAPGFHVYAIDQGALPDGGGGPQPTSIEVDESNQYRVKGDFDSIEPPSVRIDDLIWEGLSIREFGDKVTWYAPLEIAEGVDPATLQINGRVVLQACNESTCIPFDLSFEAQVGEGFDLPSSTQGAVDGEAVTSSPDDSLSLPIVLLYGMLGGLILNLMPCVLPVIGLKVMSFAKQGGESRRRILTLNLAYAAGLLSVFVVFAALATLVQTGLGDAFEWIGLSKIGLGNENFDWGELFTLTWFKVGMTGFVFAMALSFLNIWELPIPGFATSGKATEMSAKEGHTGAFFMGIFTTLLATPCSGPFLGPVFGFTLSQTTGTIFLIFLSVGFGMSLPYLLMGLFPSLVSWLPKPGAWMDTFKNLMGFVLLATVVYLFSTINPKYFLSTLSMCVGIWFACWWVGKTPMTATTSQKLNSWLGGVGTAALVTFFAFYLTLPSKHALPWQPYSPETLAAARAEGHTVLVDFTANWCPTCKWNLKFAINRAEVLKKVEENDVVPLLADWTDRSKTIENALAKLNSRSIPLMAVYAPDREEPIVLRDLLSEEKVLEALEAAGPSLDSEGTQKVSRRYPVKR